MRAESRARILQHALALFAQHGYEQTTVKMIAQAAGVAQGLLYNYFDSKEQVLVAIFEQSVADVLESFAAAEAGGAPSERIERLLRASFGILRRNLAFWQLSYHVRMQVHVITGLREQLHTWTASIVERLERYLREAGWPQPELEAAILFATIDGVAQHFALEPQRYPLEAVMETLIVRYRVPPGGRPDDPQA
ncbi:MAG TPA: TetR/AcrR family transcriptional regulator [Roseiflexaceae bacterium]|nr:TetR/AcrR family transcriptional regulator [Roseiflexaceae bacterium]